MSLSKQDLEDDNWFWAVWVQSDEEWHQKKGSFVDFLRDVRADRCVTTGGFHTIDDAQSTNEL